MSGPRSSHLGPSGPVAKLTSTLAQGRTPQASLAAGEGFIPQQKEKYLLSCEVRLRPALPHKGRTLASGETDQLSSWSPLPPPHLHPVPFPLPSAHPILSSFSPCDRDWPLCFLLLEKCPSSAVIDLHRKTPPGFGTRALKCGSLIWATAV